MKNKKQRNEIKRRLKRKAIKMADLKRKQARRRWFKKARGLSRFEMKLRATS